MPEPCETPGAAPAIAGLVLAAGAGRRFGSPKALVVAADGTPWVQLAVDVLRESGCAPVWVALGAEAERAEALLPPDARIVPAPDWAQGPSATIAAGLEAVRADGAEAVLIVPVDTPDVPVSALTRIIEAAGRPRDALVQATYRGVPGHPVLIGAHHFVALQAALTREFGGDRGARPYLVTQRVAEVECADLWSGEDIDEAPTP